MSAPTIVLALGVATARVAGRNGGKSALGCNKWKSGDHRYPMRETHGRIQGRKGQALRQRRLQRSQGLCEDCLTHNRLVTANVVDHIIPLALGGKDEDSNTRNLCHPCHDKRTAEQFGHRPKVNTGEDGWPI